MGRGRNRELDIATGIAQLVALLVLGVMFLPPVRKLLLGLGAILIGVIIVLGVVMLGVLLIRRTERKALFSSTTTSLDLKVSSPQPSQLTAVTPGKPATITPTLEQIRTATTHELIEQLRTIDWFQFEKVVALAYRKLGYTVTRRGGANPDGGIDLVIEKDGQRSAVQCKHWRTRDVGVRAMREFLGALTDAGMKRGLFITLGGYTGDAKRLAEKHGIEIVNEAELATLLERTDARFDPEALAILKDSRKYCPKCEREMVLRTAKKGIGIGSQFWGCSAFPKCRYKMPA